jgi:hypothetical protein
MLKKIKNSIKKFRKLKYQNKLFSKKDLVLRNNAIKYICNLDTKTIKIEESCRSCEFYLKNLNNKNFILFYKKFNSRIQLKERYDVFSLKKKTNKNACFKSYIIFTEFLIMNKKINNSQKLNTILKINDLLILIFNKNKHLNLIKYFKKNIKYEKYLINFFL